MRAWVPPCLPKWDQHLGKLLIRKKSDFSFQKVFFLAFTFYKHSPVSWPCGDQHQVHHSIHGDFPEIFCKIFSRSWRDVWTFLNCTQPVLSSMTFMVETTRPFSATVNSESSSKAKNTWELGQANLIWKYTAKDVIWGKWSRRWYVFTWFSIW